MYFSQNFFTLPSPSENTEQFSGFIAHAPPHKTVNLSVKYLQYTGHTSETCKFGGFVTAADIIGVYSENSILCKSSDASKFTHERNFYSSRSSLFALLYMFPPYSTVKATFTLKINHCKILNICPCIFDIDPLCIHVMPSFNSSVHQLSCTAFINFLQSISGNDSINGFNVVRESWELPFYPDMCFALNIVRRKICTQDDWRDRPRLGLKLKLDIIKYYTDKYNLDVTVRGVLQQPLAKQIQWRNCMFKCGYKSQVVVQHTYSFIQNSTSSTYFYFAKEFSGNVFLELYEPLHAQNWLEVVVRTKGESAAVEAELLGGVHHTSQVVVLCLTSVLPQTN